MSSKVFHLMVFINFVLVLCLNAHLLVAVDSSENVVQSYHNAGQVKMYKDEYSEDGKDKNIVKVSGQDEIEERRDLVLEKVRNLLGLNSFKNKFPRHGHAEHGLLSPSPAPAIETPAPAPAHVHVGHHRLHPRLPSSPKTILQPVHPEVPRRHGDEVKVKKIVIAVAVSSGAVTVISVLGLFLFCWKFGKGRRRSAKTMSVTGSLKGRSKCVNSPITTNKVSLELGPEHFCLHSVEPASAVDHSPVKQNYQTVNITWKRKETNTSLDEVSESGKDSRRSFSDNVSCSSVEETISVHEIREVVMPATDNGNCLSENETVRIEALSSDDESFHSLCDSDSSNVRISNASEGDLGDPSEVFSSQNYPKRTSPPEHSSKLHYASKKKSSTSPVKPVLAPPSQPVTPSPPRPPPPPSLMYFSSSLSSSSSKKITSTRACLSTASKVPSPSNSDSSSGSNQHLPYESCSSTQLKPHAALTSLLGTGSAKNTPPPPCPPPPFTKGKNNSLQPPPPPPGPLPQLTPVGKDGIPLPKLKPLHWDKVRATPDRSTVWDNLKSNSFEFDEKMIESLFGYKLQNASKSDEIKSKSPSPTKHILEPKRLQNITILLKALNATAEQVCNSLNQGNGLCLQQLEALVKMVPTKEEEIMLLSYQGNIDDLGYAEKFVKAVLDVPFAFLRIEAMLYRDTFEDEVVHLRKSFAMLEEACEELRSSRLFLKLLEAVLKTGNRMNVGTIRGGARAFKLDALLKLADVKGTDGKTTLLHFVVQEMIRSEGIKESDIVIAKNNQKIKKIIEESEEKCRRMGLDHVSSLSAELCNVKKTATIDLDVLASSVSTLSDGMVNLRHLVHEALPMEAQHGNFAKLMQSFLNHAEISIEELKKDEDRVFLHVRDITEYFHGDVSKDEANPLRIFVIVRDFLGMLDQVCKEIKSSKLPKTANTIVTPFR
ncbi:hypothetical protein MKW94_023132 [Papaver nudicaule]|uniref:Formin-like protein n=1 Tax=Papaver nudicaule TaxID=74823 RepID=A0AA41V2F3_PAPNU|nr:hypothetical protein [Papaver nudicaule]